MFQELFIMILNKAGSKLNMGNQAICWQLPPYNPVQIDA